jgi:hypothetical protein
MIPKAEEFRTRAIDCEMRSRKATDPSMKRQFEELAVQWHYMANQAARFGLGDRTDAGDKDPS